MSETVLTELVDLVKAKLRRLSQSPLHLQKRLNDKQVDAANERLAYPVPFALVNLYQEIGNGGFGPYFGLLGLSGGWADDSGRDAVEVYQWLRAPGDDEELGEAELPDYLLPICHQGCGVYVCIDCQTPEAIVFNYDPAKDTDQVTSTGKPFTEWLTDWAS